MLCLSRGDGRSYVVKKSLSSGSRSAAPSKVTNYHSNRSVRGPWPTTLMYVYVLCVWSALIFMTFYLWLLGKIPSHTDHIYDFGRNMGGRQAIYFMGFANTLLCSWNYFNARMPGCALYRVPSQSDNMYYK